ncbi:MAG: ABC transporter permease subunit [Alphaproteobacteria bacterium]|nr:ABC transporter permease subunit [Alphaproteobacteria bacterium]MBO4643068.1 ABC transporter permease subunit [Alphaproteobacteria bacterium]
MKALNVLIKREFFGYFITPVAWVFLMIFVSLSGLLTFYAGNFFGRGQADLQSFFLFQPWLYVFLIPAVSMRMWAEERRSGTIEMLMTLPVSTGELVLGKFFAAWAFVGVALILTTPMWITVNYLGNPDNGVILMSYLASFLIAGTFLSVGSCMSACTKSQMIAFVSTMMACILLTFLGSDAVINILSDVATEKVMKLFQSFGFLIHFLSLTRGVLDVRDLLFFISFSGVFLFATVIVLDQKKAV